MKSDSELRSIFSENLKYYLELNDKSPKDIVNDLNVPFSTVSNWYNGLKMPRMGNIEMLSNYFQIKRSDLIERRTSRNTIEKTVYNPLIKTTVKAMQNMNDDGKEQVADYATLLDESGKYKADTPTPLIAEDYTELYTIGSAAAGRGFAYGDDIEDYKLFMTTDIPDHDFAVNVDGDSMFPTIGDGETAFIVKDYDKIDNDIYLLDIDGETVIKRVVFGDDEITLISDNEAYDDRVVKEFELKQTRILGRVVGWAMPG